MCCALIWTKLWRIQTETKVVIRRLSGVDVHDPGDPDAEKLVRRADGIPDQQPPVVHAFPWPKVFGPLRCHPTER